MFKRLTGALLLSLLIVSSVFAQAGPKWQGGRIQIERTGAVTVQPKTGQVINFSGNTTIGPLWSLGYSSTNYAGTSSFQPVGIDLNLAATAGSTDGKFLSPIMGNIFGTNLTKAGNYIAGTIGALSVSGTRASQFQVGGVLGIIMDGSTLADGAVVAVIDGSDPSSVTRANAAFAARMNNNNAGSGVDYGLDLYDAGRSAAFYSGGGQPLNIAKAAIRLSNEVCIITGAGVPVDYTDGTPAATGEGYAAIGSLYIDTTAGKVYVNGGTKAQPLWKIITSA